MRKLVMVVVLSLVGAFGASAAAEEGATGHDRACQNPAVDQRNKHCPGYQEARGPDSEVDDPTPAGERVPQDSDGDEIPDGYDRDVDGDGVPDWLDNCPRQFNEDQTNTDAAEEGIEPKGDACDGDDDNDGRRDGSDNCDNESNPKQEDGDGDGVGDACDPDLDNDGVPNSEDNCEAVRNDDQADADHDGVGDACDASGNKRIGEQLSEAAQAASDTALDAVDAVLAQLP